MEHPRRRENVAGFSTRPRNNIVYKQDPTARKFSTFLRFFIPLKRGVLIVPSGNSASQTNDGRSPPILLTPLGRYLFFIRIL